MLASLGVIIAAAAVILGLAIIIARLAAERGAQQAIREQAELRAKIARRQAEIMAQRKDKDDVANDLDAGDRF